MQLRAYILVFLVIATFVRPSDCYAESVDQMIQQLQTQLAQEQANNLQNQQNAANQPAPTPTQDPQAQQPQQPQQAPDRSNKNGAAKGLAMAGAAMALIGCMKLMKDAQEAQDPQTKAMLEAMAMQQCSQGMKDMADAAKNDGNKQQLKMSDSPKQAQLTPQPSQAPTKASTPSFTMPTPAPSTEDPDPLPTPPPVAEKEKSKGQLEGELDNSEEEIAADAGMTALKPIPEAKLGFDENSRGGGTTPSAGLGSVYGSTTGGAGSKSGDPSGKTAANGAGEEDGANGRGARGKNGSGNGAGGEGGDGEGGSSGKGADPFESMMAGLFGKGAEASPFGAGFGTGISNGSGETVGGDKKINIFEYASFRYKQASRKEGRLKAKSGGRTLASVPVTAATAPETAKSEELPGIVEAKATH